MPPRRYKTQAIQVSDSDNWRTPQWLFDQLHEEFHFKVDLCADAENAKLPMYFSLENDALSRENRWAESNFANVPYSNAAPFMRKAYEQSNIYGSTTVILTRVDTSNHWWYEDVVLKAQEIRFLVGRLKFWDEQNKPHYTAKWANAVIVFKKPTLPRVVSWVLYREGQKPIGLSRFEESL